MSAELDPSPEEVGSALVAVLFVRAEPLTIAELAGALDVRREDVVRAAELAAVLLEGTGLLLQSHRGQLQLVSHPDTAWAVQRALRPEVSGRLSRPALETLAIVAYRQPVTRAAIEAIRGVNCDAVLERLEAHDLVAEVGRSDGPGRARLFGTTMRFLQVVGLSSIEQLPPLAISGGEEWLSRAVQGASDASD